MKSTITFGLILVCTLLWSACGGDRPKKMSKSSNKGSASKIDLTLSGEEIYIKHCKLCHGVDGSLQLNGAKDLRYSELSLDARIEMVKKGKNAMTPYEKILTPDEIQKVAAYTEKLKVD